MFYLHHFTVKKYINIYIKLTYKSSYNKPKNQGILLMINDETNNYYCFAITNLSELNSVGCLQGKKESIINNNNNNNNNF